MQLRAYQELAVDAPFDYWAAKGFAFDKSGKPASANPVIAMPTGTGKSLVIAGIVKRALWAKPDARILMLTHVKELITQNADKLNTLFPNAPYGICSAGLRRYDTAAPIVFGGVGSVASRVASLGWRDLVIIDECHLLSPDDTTRYQIILSELQKINPWVRIVGLSATPYRQGLGTITDGGIFTDIVCDQTTPEWFKYFIDNNYMSRLIPVRTRLALDVSNVGIAGGDYKQGALEAAVDVDPINRSMLAEACDRAANRHCWLVFTTGIDHAEHCTEILNQYGVSAVAVHSKTKQRDEKMAAFKRGRFRAMVGNNVFTTGFDHPPVDCIVVGRPTRSTALWVQLLGRGTRPYDGSIEGFSYVKQNCLVLDFARNRPLLGPIDMPNLPRKRGAEGGPPPAIACPVCDGWNHARAVICVHCGADIPHETKLFETAGSTELMSNIEPVYEWIKVDYMMAAVHNKPGKPPSLRVTFMCGLMHFDKYVMLEHTAWAGKSSREWWRLMAGSRDAEPPTSSADAAHRFSRDLRKPTEIYVHLNKEPKPEIEDYRFD